MTTTFRDFVVRAIGVAGGVPSRAYLDVCRALGPLRVELRVGGERFSVANAGAGMRVEDSTAAGAGVIIVTRVDVLLALVEGETALDEAVLEGTFDVRGALDDVLSTVDVMAGFVRVLASARASLGLLRDMREWNEESTTELCNERA